MTKEKDDQSIWLQHLTDAERRELRRLADKRTKAKSEYNDLARRAEKQGRSRIRRLRQAKT